MGNEIIEWTLNRISWKIVPKPLIDLSVYYSFFDWSDSSLLYFQQFFFFFDRSRKKKHTGKFSSIRPFIQKVAQHIRSIRDPRLKTGWKRIHLCRRVLNEPLHYSIRSTLCNEINESKNKRNNISPVSLKQLNPSKWRIAYFSRSLERTFLFFFLFGKN